MSYSQMLNPEHTMYHTLLGVLSGVFIIVRLSQPKEAASSAADAKFRTFQWSFVMVYLLMMAADWLQGPTVYTLYKYYGFTHEQNAMLFIAGFGASMIFGTFAGTLADKYGRKLNCQVYGIAYALCCLTKHFADYRLLLVGRLLGGFSTSILWSAFESWMISEHNSRGFAPELIGGTFSMMVAGNGLVAIVCGFAAQGAVFAYSGHPVAPFDLSIVCLVLGTLLISATWSENYGDTKVSQAAGLWRSFLQIKEDRKVWLIGLMQSLFEGAMYTFVFVWTPILESKGSVPHGFVFASFMISCSIGATVFNFLSSMSRPEGFMMYVFLAAAVCLAGPVFTKSPLLIMTCLCGFEVCVGIFWPSIMSLRSKYLPEEGRATIMNMFRIPLNAIVCLVLAHQDKLSIETDFALCAAANVTCAVLAAYFSTFVPKQKS
ncbi:putative molybdate-anion transporter-like [Diplonema papillatum]|nr:putative molybdate-anion transporter-like [Diplonema papillatum]